MEYCGTKVESGDITDLSSKDEEVKKDDVYSGITIDGNFSDWNAVSKNDVSQNSESGNGLSKVAAVFDGDYIYIYMKEKSENASDGVIAPLFSCYRQYEQPHPVTALAAQIGSEDRDQGRQYSEFIIQYQHQQ